jgi:hypothetical protein
VGSLINFARRFKGFLAFITLIFLGLIFVIRHLFSQGSFDQILQGFAKLSPDQFIQVIYILLGILFFLTLLLVILGFISSIRDRKRPESGLLYVVVHEEGNRTKGVADVEVRLMLPEPRTTYTDDNGGARFAFPAEFAGMTFDIGASRDGYEPARPQRVKMQHSNHITLSLKPTPLPKIDVNSNIDFTVESLRDGERIKNDDLPIKIEGKHTAKDEVSVWVILEDSYGNFYLQHPQVIFQPNGHWRAINIRPGKGIGIIHFVRVDAQGHISFKQKVEAKEWDAFYELPQNSVILQSIRIVRT